VATFCLGTRDTYDYIHDNPAVEFRTIDYTNNPLTIAGIKNMTAINTALQIDLTGQATAESIGRTFYSGIGGTTDFMRGAILSPGGKTILAIQSTAQKGEVSRIVPYLDQGSGVTFGRGDLHYVVTEYGVAHIHGKNVRERAMDLIAIAHPNFRPWLIDEAKAAGLIYRDQTYIPGKEGEYPEDLETYRTTRTGLRIFLRPVRISDEPLLKDLFYSLSDRSIYRRFFSSRTDMPHEYLQKFVIVDHSKQVTMLAVLDREEREECIGLAQYSLTAGSNTGELAIVVRDGYQNQGVGRELLSYLTLLAKKQGLFGFTADVLLENKPMLLLLHRVFPETDFGIDRKIQAGVVEMKIGFRGK
jgi:GNAT superfamily N-acetyltransferase